MKRVFLLLLLMGFLASCKNEKKSSEEVVSEVNVEQVKFREVKLDTSLFGDCRGMGCPQVEVEYFKPEKGNAIAESIDEKNSQELLELLHINEQKPKAGNIEEAVKNFGEEYFEYKTNFPNSAGGYELKLKQEVLSENPQTIVLETLFYIYTAGAHGYSGTRFLNFDSKTGKFLTHNDLINDIPAFTDFVEKAFRQQYEIPAADEINAHGFFFDEGEFVLPENIAVTDESVILIYNPYEAASYAQGSLRLFFPKKTVERWFNY